MASSYKGICVKRFPNGSVDVVVEDVAGIKIILPEDEYRKRNITPPFEELPDCEAEKGSCQ